MSDGEKKVTKPRMESTELTKILDVSGGSKITPFIVSAEPAHNPPEFPNLGVGSRYSQPSQNIQTTQDNQNNNNSQE